MSCNCNSASKTCDPCMFCTPPGVTGLTTCKPPECDKPIDINCVTYTGQDFECLNVATGNTLIQVLLNILETYFPVEECCKIEATVNVYTTTTSTSTSTTTTTSTTSTSTTSTSTTIIPPTTCNCYKLINNTDTVRPYSIKDCSTLAVVPGTIRNAQTLYLCSRSDGFVYDPSLTMVPLGLCSTGACITTTTSTTSTTTTAAPCNCIFVQYVGESSAIINYVDCTGSPSEPLIVTANTSICGSSPTSLSGDIIFYQTGETCKFGGCVTTFTISNSIASSTIDNVVPYFYAISSGSFPVAYGTTETITGIHLDHEGSVIVYITNNGASGCLELSVNGIVIDTNPVPGFTTSIHTLVCPVTTIQDEIKINLRPGPC